MHRMWRATINSWRGLIAATKSEAAVREELAALAVSPIAAAIVAVGCFVFAWFQSGPTTGRAAPTSH